MEAPRPLLVARIDEAACIGCTLCVAACPVDAIVGAAKLMHTVLADRCTGCELCLPPCPVDCIALLPSPRAWTLADEALADTRSRDHTARLQRHAAKRGTSGLEASAPQDPARERRRAAVAAALDRARSRRAARSRSISRA